MDFSNRDTWKKIDKTTTTTTTKHIIEWLTNNFLYFNYIKTKVMLIGQRQRLVLVDSFTVTAADTVLSRIYQFKYLGVMLDPYLS